MEAVENRLREATSKYQQVNVETADQITLIVMLYDGLLRFLSKAVEKLRAGDAAYYECKKASDIAFHLLSTLREDGGGLSKNLTSLYFYIYKQIVMANMERNARLIEEILPVVRELKSGWEELKAKQKKKGV